MGGHVRWCEWCKDAWIIANSHPGVCLLAAHEKGGEDCACGPADGAEILAICALKTGGRLSLDTSDYEANNERKIDAATRP